MAQEKNILNLEIRHLKSSNLVQLSNIIDKTKAWNELLEKLSKPLNLTLESIHMIEQQYHCGKSPTLALLNHWSITGRRRPTIKTLLQYLRACNLRWAEDYVLREVLSCDTTNHDVTDNFAIHYPNEKATISVKNSTQDQDIENQFIIEDEFRFKDLNNVISNLQQYSPRYSFESIYLSTNKFCHRPFIVGDDLGRRIGDGRFSSVFLAQTYIEDSNNDKNNEYKRQQSTVAAKLLKAECKLEYLVNEINLAMKIKHDNILELVGISIGELDDLPRFMCLIYPFMENGSLLECLDTGLRCINHEQIKWTKRIGMAIKIGRGISYLHTFMEGTIIHRDIKTANILIDYNQNPKLGDFTLVRQLDTVRNNETQYSQSIIGTSVYMPPEAFRGDISTKFDIFSFGIVLFELLSGRRPFDEDLSEDLLTYVSEKLSDIDDKIIEREAHLENTVELRNSFLLEFLDKRAGNWDKFQVASKMFTLALRATEVRKRDRPEMSDIVGDLEKCLSEHGIEDIITF